MMSVRGGRAVLLCALVLGGCGGGDEDDLRAWMEDEARNLHGAVRALPEIRPFAVAEYLGSGADDPFRSSRLELERQRVVQRGPRPDPGRQREPLEEYPLESLRMVGMLSRGGQAQALIQADASLHPVRVGNHVGRDFGVVTRITDTSVTLTELVQDVQGDWVERVRTLNLQEAGR